MIKFKVKVMLAMRDMTQKELAKGAASVEVMVDNFAARENVTRLAESKGYTVAVKEENGEFTLTLTK